MVVEGDHEFLRILVHLLHTLRVYLLKSMNASRAYSFKTETFKKRHVTSPISYERHYLSVLNDRWSNNLQIRAPYTLRSALFYLRVFTHTSPIWSPHPLSQASNKSRFTSEIFAKSLLARKITSFSSLRHAFVIYDTQQALHKSPLAYSLGCYKRHLLRQRFGGTEANFGGVSVGGGVVGSLRLNNFLLAGASQSKVKLCVLHQHSDSTLLALLCQTSFSYQSQ